MSGNDNVTGARWMTPGLLLGLFGVLAFSFSLPATKLAVADFNPWLVSFGRAGVAAILGAAYLGAVRAPRPTRTQIRQLAVVALGVIVGFPLFTSLALTTSESAHGAVFVATLPAATALAAVIFAGERPGLLFWLAAMAGLGIVAGFAMAQSGGSLVAADGFLFIAVVLCAVGYAYGGVVSRSLGGARTISWALVLSAPVSIPLTVALGLTTPLSAGASAWAGFAYVSVVSMFLGFFAWYAGLARGGVARIGQVQLLQPPLTLAWSALVLGEHVGAGTFLAVLAVLVTVAVTQRARVARRERPRTESAFEAAPARPQA